MDKMSWKLEKKLVLILEKETRNQQEMIPNRILDKEEECVSVLFLGSKANLKSNMGLETGPGNK